ncbi:conserved hypothetical protein [sediment metagenome]|uniref:LURP-one-related family protein n=1 Tax=sediment metagenome TaxID=749907 RepID=D9PLB4_9ZZZZ
MKCYLVKSKLGIGRDFAVYDDEEAKNKVYEIDAKMGFGTKADIKDANGNIIYTAKGKVINIPRRMEFFSPDGSVAAKLTAKFSPIKSRLTMVLSDGAVWELAGNIVGKSYTVKSGDTTIVDINQKWMTIRDKYFVEIADDVDVVLALGLVWAVDIWREGKNN